MKRTFALFSIMLTLLAFGCSDSTKKNNSVATDTDMNSIDTEKSDQDENSKDSGTENDSDEKSDTVNTGDKNDGDDTGDTGHVDNDDDKTECTGVSFQVLPDAPFGQTANYNYAGVITLPDSSLNEMNVGFFGAYDMTAAPISYDLSAGDNSNYETCTECVILYRDLKKNDKEEYVPAGIMFQKSGSLEIIDGKMIEVSLTDGSKKSIIGPESNMEIKNLVLEEVTINEETFKSTPVPNGECLELQGVVSWNTMKDVEETDDDEVSDADTEEPEDEPLVDLGSGTHTVVYRVDKPEDAVTSYLFDPASHSWNYYFPGTVQFGFTKTSDYPQQIVGAHSAMRFRRINIPKNAVIDNVKFVIYPHNEIDSNNKVYMMFAFEDSGNSLPFDTGNCDNNRPDQRKLTESRVTDHLIKCLRDHCYMDDEYCENRKKDCWDRNVPYEIRQKNKELAKALQHVVNRDDWEFGNAVTLKSVGMYPQEMHSEEKKDYSDHRTVMGYKKDAPEKAPMLEVTFTVSE